MKSLEERLNSLNENQAKAVNKIEGPVLVLAGAGTGKTRVITFRIGLMLAQGIPPNQILAVTFTNKAAKEMKERVLSMVKKQDTDGLVISTFHSFCVRVLRQRIECLGYRKNFSIYDIGDQMGLLRRILREVKVAGADLEPKNILPVISRAKNRCQTPSDFERSAADAHEQLTALVYHRYQEHLKTCNAVDFDDLLLLTRELFLNNEEVRNHFRDRFRYVLIDEFQDTNEVQYQIIHHLCKEHRNLCVVGDDDQSIYGWRGADVRNIARFELDFSERIEVKLEQNYRSTESILKVSNAVIKNNLSRKEKSLISQRGEGVPVELFTAENARNEAETVVNRIVAQKTMGNGKWSDYAIMFRTNTQPRLFEEILRSQKIPYTLIGGPSFFDRKEIKDMTAYLSVLANPDDEISLLRIINTPPRGIGLKTIEKINHYSLESGISFHEALNQVDKVDSLPPATIKKVDEFSQLLSLYREKMNHGGISETLRSLLEEVNYTAELERLFDDPLDVKKRSNIVEEMINMAGDYEARARDTSLVNFLEELALNDAFKQDKDTKSDSVRLITYHSAKGLEFPIVFLVGIEEGILPHSRSVNEEIESELEIEEERRLFYVGITRARDQLTLTMASIRKKFGKAVITHPSRFLGEIPEQLLKFTNPRSEKPASAKVADSYFDAIRARLSGN